MKMKRIRDTRIRTKLILLGAVSVLGLFILGQESIATASKINNVGADMSNTWLNAVITAEELNTATSNYRIHEMRYGIVNTEEQREQILLSLEEISKEIEVKFSYFKTLQTSEVDQGLMVEAQKTWAQYVITSDAYLAMESQENLQHVQSLAEGESQELFETTAKLFEEVVIHTKDRTTKAKEEGEDLYQRLSQMKLLVIVLDSIFVLWLIWYLVKSIEKPAQELTEIAHRATNGNLEVESDYESEDEIGDLTISVNGLIRRFRKILTDQKYMIQELCDENYEVKSTCESAYRGDFAPILYSYTCLQSRLKAMDMEQEEELDRMKIQIMELEKQIEELKKEI